MKVNRLIVSFYNIISLSAIILSTKVVYSIRNTLSNSLVSVHGIRKNIELLLSYVYDRISIIYNSIEIIHKLYNYNNASIGLQFTLRNVLYKTISYSYASFAYVYSILTSIYSTISFILKSIYEIILNPRNIKLTLELDKLSLDLINKTEVLVLEAKDIIRALGNRLASELKYIGEEVKLDSEEINNLPIIKKFINDRHH